MKDKLILISLIIVISSATFVGWVMFFNSVWVQTEDKVEVTRPIVTVEVVEEVEVIEPTLNIPIKDEHKEYVIQASSMYDVPIPLIVAIMSIESNFVADVISPTNDLGYMGINRSNVSSLTKSFHTDDFLNPYNNIVAGTYWLRGIMDNGYNLSKSLMVYNMGSVKAKELWQQGVYETDYTRKVMEKNEAYSGTI